jgi:hypothetical protein
MLVARTCRVGGAATRPNRTRAPHANTPPHPKPTRVDPKPTPAARRAFLPLRVIPLCLRHRLRKDPLADIDSGDKVREVFKVVFGLE